MTVVEARTWRARATAAWVVARAYRTNPVTIVLQVVLTCVLLVAGWSLLDLAEARRGTPLAPAVRPAVLAGLVVLGWVGIQAVYWLGFILETTYRDRTLLWGTAEEGVATVLMRRGDRSTKASFLASWPRRGTGVGAELARQARQRARTEERPLVGYALRPMARRYEAEGMTITRSWLGGMFSKVEDLPAGNGAGSSIDGDPGAT